MGEFKVYTAAEAAKKIGWKYSTFVARARKLGIGRVFGSRTLLFTDDDLAEIQRRYSVERKLGEPYTAESFYDALDSAAKALLEEPNQILFQKRIRDIGLLPLTPGDNILYRKWIDKLIEFTGSRVGHADVWKTSDGKYTVIIYEGEHSNRAPTVAWIAFENELKDNEKESETNEPAAV